MQTRLLLLLLYIPTIAVGQQTNKNDPYSQARKIISDLDSIVAPNGVQESYELPINGLKQWVYARGQNKANPVILFVHGGPASPMAPLMWMYQRPLEEYFTLIQYDQRAAGKTYAANDTSGLAPTITIDQYVGDAISLSEVLRKKYHKQKIILIGHSWGTIVALKAALSRPDLFYAYVGMGQVINSRDNEQLSFDYALKTATQNNNRSALQELHSIAPYPGHQPLTRQRIIIARKWAQYYGGLSAYRTTSDYYFQAPFLSPEYEEKDIGTINAGNLFTLGKLLPEFLAVDFTRITRCPIPILMLMGRHDYTTPSQPTAHWLQRLKAPYKKGIWFENSAHLIPLEEPGKLLVTLLTEVKPLTVEKTRKLRIGGSR